jgi:hypothetical protein
MEFPDHKIPQELPPLSRAYIGTFSNTSTGVTPSDGSQNQGALNSRRDNDLNMTVPLETVCLR